MAGLLKALNIEFSVDSLLAKGLTIVFNVNITTIVGVIRDYTGTPVPYGRLHLYREWGPAEVLEADANGRFSITGVEGDEITIVIADSNYDRKINFPILEAGEEEIEYLDIPIPAEDESTRWKFPTINFRP